MIKKISNEEVKKELKILNYNLCTYQSDCFNEEIFMTLEEKRKFLKERLDETFKRLFEDENITVEDIYLTDYVFDLRLNNDDRIVVRKLLPSEMKLALYLHEGNFLLEYYNYLYNFNTTNALCEYYVSRLNKEV